ncbi:MAG: alpha-L-fucosidase [Bythopirellula sp.]|nr:alpha-L-fucosidase [Bythopirellula sp.]
MVVWKAQVVRLGVFAVIGAASLLVHAEEAAKVTPVPTLIAPEVPYEPTAENLAAREEFRDDEFGIFIHWGVYSVLGRGEWVMNFDKIPLQDYEKLTKDFNPTKFNAAEWVSLFKQAGAKYITITSKHHDGFAMFDAETGDWDIADRTEFGRDPLKELAEECAKQDMKLFFYHSHLDWHHPDYFPRGMNALSTGRPNSGNFEKYLEYMDGQLAELLSGRYGKIGGIWFDGWWDQQSKRVQGMQDADPRATRIDWHLRRTYDLIHKLQPACLIGNNHHLAPFAGEDFQMFERDLPGQNKGGHSPDAKIGNLPLETCDTVNGNWGYHAGDNKFKSKKQLIHYLVRAAGNNANFLLNVGPKPDGTIDEESAKRLTEIGEWLAKNQASIRPTRGGPVAPQKWGASTRHGEQVYLHILDTDDATEGWLTLTGTEKVELAVLKQFPDGLAVETRRNAAGQLEVKLPDQGDEIDLILVGTLSK